LTQDSVHFGQCQQWQDSDQTAIIVTHKYETLRMRHQNYWITEGIPSRRTFFGKLM